MPRSDVVLSVDDAALPSLAQALDGASAGAHVAHALGVDLGLTADSVRCHARVINHKPGKRCSIRYTLAYHEPPIGAHREAIVFGKLYSSPDRAEHMFERTLCLRAAMSSQTEALSIPAPLLLVRDLGLILQQYIPMAGLRDSLNDEPRGGAITAAAAWLAQLHGTSPISALKLTSRLDELGKIDAWCASIAPSLPETTRRALYDLSRKLHATAASNPRYEHVMIHKDFYHGNVLWDRSGYVLDFDELSIGEPALDIAHFCAHLESLALWGELAHDMAVRASSAFAAEYLLKSNTDVRPGLPFYRAWTLLKLAATEVSRRRREWQRMTERLTAAACASADTL